MGLIILPVGFFTLRWTSSYSLSELTNLECVYSLLALIVLCFWMDPLRCFLLPSLLDFSEPLSWMELGSGMSKASSLSPS